MSEDVVTEPPTAVFAASDMMAMGAMRAIQAAGLTVPDDIAVVGFDDIQVAAVAHPPLTTIRQEKADLGTLAAETLLRRIESGRKRKQPGEGSNQEAGANEQDQSDRHFGSDENTARPHCGGPGRAAAATLDKR